MKAKDYLKKLRDLHPYREAGKPETYSKYNEGWSDALDLVQNVFEQAQKDAYNQALEDAANHEECDFTMEDEEGRKYNYIEWIKKLKK